MTVYNNSDSSSLLVLYIGTEGGQLGSVEVTLSIDEDALAKSYQVVVLSKSRI